eukprot:10216608-Alexandrium_andersonii.AAC.1
MRAQLAAVTLDVHYKRSRAAEEAPLEPPTPTFTLPERKPAPQLQEEPAPADGGEVGPEQPVAAAAPADGGGDRGAEDTAEEDAPGEVEPPNLLEEAG